MINKNNKHIKTRKSKQKGKDPRKGKRNIQKKVPTHSHTQKFHKNTKQEAKTYLQKDMQNK